MTWIVIPTYNEKDNIEAIIRGLFALPEELSVLVVDDNSPDGTAEIVKKLQPEFPRLHLEVRQKKNGLGGAYIHGFRYALIKGAAQIVQMDADFSHSPTEVPKLLALLATNELVIGSRYSKGISVINWPLHRLLLSLGANIYASIVTGMPLKDSTGGFKAWKANTLKGINFETVQADGYGFQIVMNHRAWKKGYKITEVPIIFTERREGQSKMTKKIIWEAFWLVWQLRFSST